MSPTTYVGSLTFLIGWMENRLRMVTASFLVKSLMLDWRESSADAICRADNDQDWVRSTSWSSSSTVISLPITEGGLLQSRCSKAVRLTDARLS